MTAEEAIKWFEQIAAKKIKKERDGGTYLYDNQPVYRYDRAETIKWITEAASALKSVFPSYHAVMEMWESHWKDEGGRAGIGIDDDRTFERIRAVFDSALAMLKEGRLSSLVDGIRAETESGLLDQADVLLEGGYLVAAAVISGGALETHLGGYCEKHSISWRGDGSISKYNDAVAQARKAGRRVYAKTDGKLVTAWGGIRNDAAHDPANFNRETADVRRMIDGIREFIARVP